MGLLDIFNTGDPQKDAAISRGLLSAGLQLMQSKGRFLPNLGMGGMAGIGGFDQERQRQLHSKRIGLQDQLLQSQVDQQKREAELAKLPGQFYRAPSSPGVDATGGMDTAMENPANASGPGGFDMGGYVQALMGKAPVQALQLQAALAPKPPEYKTVGNNLVRIGRDGKVEPVFQQPKEAEDTPIAKLIRERDKFPIGDPTRRIYDDAIEKAKSHPPAATQNNYGPVQEVDLGGGKKGLLQPPTRPGGPSQIIKMPGTDQPATRPPDANAGKLGEAQKKQVSGIDALGSAVDEYVKELSTFPLTGVINPADRARIGTKYNNMMLQAKEAYNLGVLNGPDYQILQSVVADPVSLRGITTSNRSLANQATELKRMMEQVKKGITNKEEDDDPLNLRGRKK